MQNGVVDCCEAAFVFGLQVEDIWCTTALATAERGSDFSADLSPPRIPCLVVAILLRHASLTYAGARSAEEIYDGVLQHHQGLTPSALTAISKARAGDQTAVLTTREAVCLAAGSGPLYHQPLHRLEPVFAVLLQLEKAIAAVVEAERSGRGALINTARIEWKELHFALLSRPHRRRSAEAVHLLPGGDIGVPELPSCSTSWSARRTAPQPPEGPRAQNSSSDVSSLFEKQALHEIAAQLQQTRRVVGVLHESLSTAADATTARSWCYDPISEYAVASATRISCRVMALEEKTSALADLVLELVLRRAGQRVLRLAAARAEQKSAETPLAPLYSAAVQALVSGAAVHRSGAPARCPSPATLASAKEATQLLVSSLGSKCTTDDLTRLLYSHLSSATPGIAASSQHQDVMLFSSLVRLIRVGHLYTGTFDAARVAQCYLFYRMGHCIFPPVEAVQPLSGEKTAALLRRIGFRESLPLVSLRHLQAYLSDIVSLVATAATPSTVLGALQHQTEEELFSSLIASYLLPRWLAASQC